MLRLIEMVRFTAGAVNNLTCFWLIFIKTESLSLFIDMEMAPSRVQQRLLQKLIFDMLNKRMALSREHSSTNQA